MVKVPESIYQHLIRSMASCYSFRIYRKGPDPPLLRELVGDGLIDIESAIKKLYDAVHLPEHQLLQACGLAVRQARKQPLSLSEREEILTKHPVTMIVPDRDDRRDFWDVIDDIQVYGFNLQGESL